MSVPIDPERVLAASHDWGYVTVSMLSDILLEHRKKLSRHISWLLAKGFLSDLGHAQVKVDSPLRGHWYAITRKIPRDMYNIAPRFQKTRALASARPSDIPTASGYYIPRHQATVVRTVAWLCSALDYFLDVRFAVESEHMIRTRMGQNPNITERQREALGISIGALESFNVSVPDARFLLPEFNFPFRLEVECSTKTKRAYLGLEELYRSQGVPVLYVFSDAQVMQTIGAKLPHSPIITKLVLDDVEGLRRFLGANGINRDIVSR